MAGAVHQPLHHRIDFVLEAAVVVDGAHREVLARAPGSGHVKSGILDPILMLGIVLAGMRKDIRLQHPLGMLLSGFVEVLFNLERINPARGTFRVQQLNHIALDFRRSVGSVVCHLAAIVPLVPPSPRRQPVPVCKVSKRTEAEILMCQMGQFQGKTDNFGKPAARRSAAKERARPRRAAGPERRAAPVRDKRSRGPGPGSAAVKGMW